MATAPFSVFVVPDDAPATTELMGTKPKFWFSRDGEMWLFKATRPGSGRALGRSRGGSLGRQTGTPPRSL